MYSIRKNSQKHRVRPNLDLEPSPEEILNVVINDFGLSAYEWMYYSRESDYADVFHSAERIAATRKIKFAQRKEEMEC